MLMANTTARTTSFITQIDKNYACVVQHAFYFTEAQNQVIDVLLRGGLVTNAAITDTFIDALLVVRSRGRRNYAVDRFIQQGNALCIGF